MCTVYELGSLILKLMIARVEHYMRSDEITTPDESLPIIGARIKIIYMFSSCPTCR